MIYVYIIAAVLAVSLGGVADHFVLGNPKYEKLQSQFDGYKTQQAQLNTNAANAYSAGLAKQLTDFQNTTANNARVMQELQNENASVAHDRDVARKLFNAAAIDLSRATAATAESAGGRPGTPPVPGGDADQSLTDETGGAIRECRDSLQHYTALQDEVIPQLKVTP